MITISDPLESAKFEKVDTVRERHSGPYGGMGCYDRRSRSGNYGRIDERPVLSL